MNFIILTFTIYIPLTINTTIQLHGFLTAFHILTRDISCCSSFHTCYHNHAPTVYRVLNVLCLDLLCSDKSCGLWTFNKVLFDFI